MSEFIKSEVFSWIKTIVFAVVLAVLINRFVIVNAAVPTGSMENTIMPNDRIIALRLSYYFGEPERGDIVVFKYPDNEDVLYVKRVIGLPGDKVQIIDGKVYINDSETPLDEPYLPEPPEGDYGPYYVPEDSYFMLGDNRNWSKDSRFWTNTYVKKEKVLAKAIFRYYPFNKIGVIEKD